MFLNSSFHVNQVCSYILIWPILFLSQFISIGRLLQFHAYFLIKKYVFLIRLKLTDTFLGIQFIYDSLSKNIVLDWLCYNFHSRALNLTF
jgi:hypothetical protein